MSKTLLELTQKVISLEIELKNMAFKCARQQEEMEKAKLKVNNHQSLVNLLEAAYEKLEIECSGIREYKGGVPTQVLFSEIRAALNKDKDE